MARASTVTIEGAFQRHVSPRHRALTGSAAGGRWGPQGAFPVFYLARPTASVIVEAYRHLVEPVEGMKPELVAPRRLLTCEVRATSILDLRSLDNQEIVGLTIDDLMSDIGNYAGCHRVGKTAHQLGLHGIIAPAATGLGETLALFERHLPADEQPVLINEERWEQLPADPRQLRIADPADTTGPRR
ncbi:MAG: RES family NAD+ phosphorylase [Solirubrobacteraceae bacterium]